MKKLLVLLLITISSSTFAQKLTYDDFKSIIPFLQKEDFKGAFEKTNTLLKKGKADTSDIKAQISYMNIYSAAGMVSKGEMSYDNLEKNMNKFVGKQLKMPGHPCVDSTKQAWNSFQFITQDGILKGMTMGTNRLNTSILLFEYYEFAETLDPNDYIGENVRCGGILKSFEINPNKSGIWIVRIHISEAYVRLFTPY